jgi:hypothetical protein
MKRIVFFIVALTCFFNSYSQLPDFYWTKTLGGSSTESHGAFAMISLNWGRTASVDLDKTNGNIYFVTTSFSSDNYLNQNHGEEDIWLVCLNTEGDTLWTRVFGGSSWERVHRVRALSDGGCVIVGSSHSNDGAFTSSISSYYEAFLIRVDTQGEIVWSKMFGGSADDYLYDIIETSDGHLIACGESYSVDNDLLGAGNGMNWALKINKTTGNKIWSKTYLGPDGSSADWLENVYRLTELEDNQIIMTGFTTPDFNDFNQDRINIISIDLEGNLNWTKKIGDAGSGDYPAAIISYNAESFYILGKLAGTITDGDYDYYGGGGDFWLVKLDNSGNILSEQNYGGSNLDVPYDLRKNDNGDLYMVGLSKSYDYDAYDEDEEAPSGWIPTHYWLLKVDSDGEPIYNIKMGGGSNDFASGIAISDDNNNLIIVGASESDDGDVEINYGGRDIWLVSLKYDDDEPVYGCTDPLAINYNPDATHDDGSCEYDETYVSSKQLNIFNVYPNPFNDIIRIEVSSIKTISITDVTGKEIYRTIVEDISVLDLSHLCSGVYYLTATDNISINTVRIIKIED